VDVIVGQRGLYDTPRSRALRGMIISRLTNVLGGVTKGRSFLDLPAMFNDVSAAGRRPSGTISPPWDRDEGVLHQLYLRRPRRPEGD
jgi:hypothetical protein